MAELIDFGQAGTGLIARRLVTATDQLGHALRDALFRQLRDLEACNILDLEPELQLKAITSMGKVKAMIAETYPDVHQRLADISVKEGRSVTNEEVAQVCRTLHPECFEVRIT